MNFEEKTLTSKVVYDGKVITVIKDDVEVADGHKSFREVILHSGGVVIVALKDSRTILLVKQYRYPLKANSFGASGRQVRNWRRSR